jgi:hypothetical protein
MYNYEKIKIPSECNLILKMYSDFMDIRICKNLKSNLQSNQQSELNIENTKKIFDKHLIECLQTQYKIIPYFDTIYNYEKNEKIDMICYRTESKQK